MNRDESVFLAKKLFTELVFNTAYIEGVNVTFPQTQAILDGAIVNNIPIFWDGNKRTSTIIASKILIEAGAGVLTIGKSNALNFNEALLHFYDTAEKEPLKECLRKCIKTIDRVDNRNQ